MPRILGYLFMCACIARAHHSLAQNWADVGLPGVFHDWGDFYVDPGSGELFATGWNITLPGQIGVFQYSAGTWDTLGLFGNVVRNVVRYNDTLVAAGGFYTVEGEPIAHIAYYDGAVWHPYGDFESSINLIRVIDGELYAVGSFSMVDGQPCDGIVKRVGGSWEPVGDFGDVPQPYLFDVIKYDGKLVACGNMSIVGENYRDVYVFEDGAWGPLGGGLLGTFSGGWEMTIYNDELILGGGFYINAGNAGQCIMRWNGSIWQPLGVGTTDNTDSYGSAPNIHALAVHDGKLFVGGGFSYAGHVPAQGVATWDGDQWCGLGSSLGLVHDIEFYGDTLLVMCGENWIDGEYNSGAVRYLHPTYDDTCSLGTGMSTMEDAFKPSAFVGDDGGTWILGLADGQAPFTVLDVAGRVVEQGYLCSLGGRALVPFTDRYGSGIYLIHVQGYSALRLYLDRGGF